MEEIKVGDIVCLKSDNNACFTVGFINENEKTAWVYWFDYTTRSLKNTDVPLAILNK